MARGSVAGERVGIAVVGLTATAVALVVTVAGFAASALWMFQLLAASGVLIGLVVAFGALDRPLRWRRDGDPAVSGATPTTPAPALAADVRRRLDGLDPVEHRQLDLARPWPTVVVGPTGIAVVDVVDVVDDEAVSRSRAVVEEVRALVGVAGGVAIPTVGVLVRPGPTPVRDPDATVVEVGPDELVDALARGPLLPMTTVTGAFSTLSAHLALDLRLVS